MTRLKWSETKEWSGKHRRNAEPVSLGYSVLHWVWGYTTVYWGYSTIGENPQQNDAGCPFRIFGPAIGWVSNQSMRGWFEVTKNPIFVQICTPFCHLESLHLVLYYWFRFSYLDQNCNLACRLDRLFLTLRTPFCSSESFFPVWFFQKWIEITKIHASYLAKKIVVCIVDTCTDRRFRCRLGFCYLKTHIILPLFLHKDVDVEKYIILIVESVYGVTLGSVVCGYICKEVTWLKNPY